MKTDLSQLFNRLLLASSRDAMIGFAKKKSMNYVVNFLLQLMAAMYNYKPSLRKYLKGVDGWINFSVGFKTLTGSVEQAIFFENGKVKVFSKGSRGVDVTINFINEDIVVEMLKATPNETLNLILKNRMIIDGNLALLQLFNYYISILLGKKHQRMLNKAHKKKTKERKKEYSMNDPEISKELSKRQKNRLKADSKADRGVKFLDDPYLSEYEIDDFPRIKSFHDIHFNEKPLVCIERPKLLTDWYRKNGFEHDSEGKERNSHLRQAYAFKYLMENKKAVIRRDDLLAGTTTSKDTTGVIIYPDAHGTMIWGELGSLDKRMLNPYGISEQEMNILHHDVFPFWAKRNFREWVRTKHGFPLSLKIDERFVAYFVWSSVGISHTIPNFPTILSLGTNGIIDKIESKLDNDSELNNSQKDSLRAMKICLKGLNAYALNLSEETKRLAENESDPKRKAELENLAKICKKVPANPADSLHEALNSIWIAWIGLHMENTNTGLSLGRLDQWLFPFYENDIKSISDPDEKREYIKKAIELVGCFYMRCTDHLPLVPDIGNYLFGGSPSDQAITLGGITPDGKDGVNDMTYILLKVTEMLSLRDPNVNARFHPDINSETYLKRLCEVNYITAATPSMHNDKAVFESLENFGFPISDVRDWSSTGCVEPTLSGKHMGHTGSILMNLVAGLEMALNNGFHPLMNWDLGPKTGKIEENNFSTFEKFLDAYKVQQSFLINEAVRLNNMLAAIHAQYRPTPLLSTLMDGCVEKGLDATQGGAKYNSSGTSNIGLVDVVDSLMVIKKLVFDKKLLSFQELKKAIDSDFSEDPKIYALVQKLVPRFGSGNIESFEMAQKVTAIIHDIYAKHKNYRNGKYTTGFWSMSQHVAYGNLSGALPSGRRAGKAFTPGLTPHPGASTNFLDNIRDVARLDPKNMENNIAFNVKLIPDTKDSHENIVNVMHSYVRTYFRLGGMQMQFNVVTAEMLKDAMANPENYKNLLVRISGYNAYFVTLHREMQIELIERAGYGI